MTFHIVFDPNFLYVNKTNSIKQAKLQRMSTYWPVKYESKFSNLQIASYN